MQEPAHAGCGPACCRRRPCLAPPGAVVNNSGVRATAPAARGAKNAYTPPCRRPHAAHRHPQEQIDPQESPFFDSMCRSFLLGIAAGAVVETVHMLTKVVGSAPDSGFAGARGRVCVGFATLGGWEPCARTAAA